MIGWQFWAHSHDFSTAAWWQECNGRCHPDKTIQYGIFCSVCHLLQLACPFATMHFTSVCVWHVMNRKTLKCETYLEALAGGQDTCIMYIRCPRTETFWHNVFYNNAWCFSTLPTSRSSVLWICQATFERSDQMSGIWFQISCATKPCLHVLFH